MNIAPKVSIIVPLHNAARWVVETVESVRRQSYEDYEVVFVDDCSFDDSLSIVQRAAHGLRFSTVRLTVNSGPAVARKSGLECASGRFVLYLDSDDTLTPKALEEHVKVLENGADVSYANMVSHLHGLEKPWSNELSAGFEGLVEILRNAGDGGWWRAPGAIMIRRDFAEKAEWLWKVALAEEVHYYLCLWQLGAKFVKADFTGLMYRVHNDSLSHQNGRMIAFLGQLQLVDTWIDRVKDKRLFEVRASILKSVSDLVRIEHSLSSCGARLNGGF